MVIVPSGIRDVQEEILRVQIEPEGHLFPEPAPVPEQMDDRTDGNQVSGEMDRSKRRRSYCPGTQIMCGEGCHSTLKWARNETEAEAE